MKNSLILIIFFYLEVSYQTSCKCEQLVNLQDCLKLNELNCSWDSIKNTCQLASTGMRKSLSMYCRKYNQQQCPQMTGCAWNNNFCTYFTGCTSFQKYTNEDCQKISQICITNGINCINKGICESYKTSQTCQVDLNNQYCFWDFYNNNCQDATTCDKLPLTLNTDESCRAINSICTSKIGGGCQESGDYCSDQIAEISCVWNKSKTQKCFWNGKQCVDRICSNAPINLFTDEECQLFGESEQCTTKIFGGCKVRTTCQEASAQADCTFDQTGKPCYWNGQLCVDKICSNAPINFTTNQECQNYLSICITNGQGCVQNGLCESAKIQIACSQDINGNSCFWNEKCYQKTCSNAPKTYNTFELCNKFLSDCTISVSGFGCEDKTCDNAPLTFKTTEECESYLPYHSCVIRKSNQGCMVNSDCSELGSASCVHDIYNRRCFWDGFQCKLKTCLNAPPTMQTHNDCQNYSTSCTVNQFNAGCVNYTCENLFQQNLCNDFVQGCSFRPTCFQKQCAFAPNTFITHQDCQQYLPTCTLSNLGYGCQIIPLLCKAIIIEAACYLRQNFDGYSDCGWDGTQCIDKDCNTLPKILKHTQDCYNLLPEKQCVSANPIKGIVSGCISLPKQCSQRQTLDNCEVQFGDLKCVWNSLELKCLEKICASATIYGTTGYLQIVNSSNCSKYLENCLVSNDGTTCMPQVKYCNMLFTSSNCKDNALIGGGDCYWNTVIIQCVDKICVNIPFDTHFECNNVLNSCTVGYKSPITCQPLHSCNSYVVKEQCHINMSGYNCYWTGNACRDYVCLDAPKSIQYSTSQSCQNFKVTSGMCNVIPRTLNKGCVQRTSCEGYVDQLQCVKDFTNNDCLWFNNKCWLKSSFTCKNIILDNYNDINCENAIYFCKASINNTECEKKQCEDYQTKNGLRQGPTVQSDEDCKNLDATCSFFNDIFQYKCQTRQDSCSGYKQKESCTNSNIETCIWNDIYCTGATTDCNHLAGDSEESCVKLREFCKSWNSGFYVSCTSHSCEDKLGYNLTYEDCQQYDKSCSVAVDGSKCVTMQYSCYQYGSNLNSCYRSQSGMCAHNNQDTNQSQYCLNITLNTPCFLLYLGTGNYSDASCSARNPSCTNDGDTGCKQKVCSDKQNPQSFEDCYNWYNSCTYDNNSHCVQISYSCSQQTPQNCYRTAYKDCEVIGSVCNEKTNCSRAPTAFNTHEQCTQYYSQCTVAPIGGCIFASYNCNANYTEEQCKIDYNHNKCFWSEFQQLCLYFDCYNFDQTDKFDTHEKCYTTSNRCTVRADYGKLKYGCQQLTSCSQYQIEEQCKIDYQQKACGWLSSQNFCVEKNCFTAPKSFNTHEQCVDYLGSNTCTVQVSQLENNFIYQGCMPLSTCDVYIVIEQCQIDGNGNQCVWIGTACKTFTCETSPETNNTLQLCQNYKSDCTVNQEGNGCMTLLGSCKEYLREENCVKTNSHQFCSWDQVNKICVVRVCELAPETILTDFNCNNYLAGCTKFNNQKCFPKKCEDFQLTQEDQCKNISPNCTTNGIMCVTRGTCIQALSQSGCTTDIDGKLCQWIEAQEQNSAYCTTRTCATAPQYTTEKECNNYLTNCTIKINGGCILKTSCSSAQVQEACPSEFDGISCQWDQDKNICRQKRCSDYQSQTHDYCSQLFNNCSIGLNGYCTEMQECQSIMHKEICNVGIDGPCLWIQKIDSGACYLYTSCESIKWQTDKECKQISDQCTTNGTNCVSITTCNQTNISGGCVTGTDGICYQTIGFDQRCKVFTSCQAIGYKTHVDCQSANASCTTNGIWCIPLNECSKYSLINCFINVQGIKYQNDLIQSTGNCIWDNELNQCRDESCADQKGNDHQTCNSKLSICTYDGTQCIEKQYCNSYPMQYCMRAEGIDGFCHWQFDVNNLNEGQICRARVCQDIVPLTSSTMECFINMSTCITEGLKCIPKNNCVSYSTEQACLQNGLDGICVYTDKCQLMKECKQANNEQTCKSAQDKCFWNDKTCENHNCSTYQKVYAVCQNFMNFQSQLTICQTQNDICSEILPENLDYNDCYTISEYLYAWNPITSKCALCKSDNPSGNNSNTTQNQTQEAQNTTETNSQRVLQTVVIVLFSLI